MAPSNTLRLYEALELRAEYDARIGKAQEGRPETKSARGYATTPGALFVRGAVFG
ncbi:MAG: hypothetical protein IT369_04050 [Candidatus Latescibacteria bacterium]|nr:hypothetical protein [Candidatus Latescibacterota bacterium]